jgi:hypothetical protein
MFGRKTVQSIKSKLTLIGIFFFSKKTESPFESRPKLARTNSFSKKKPESSQDDSAVSSAGSSGVIRIDYNPSSGVTFRENKTSTVQVVGKGYNDDPEVLEKRGSVGGLNKVRDRRRMQKGRRLADNLKLILTKGHIHFAVNFALEVIISKGNNTW